MKRFLALLLAVCILFSLAAVNVVAVEEISATDSNMIVEETVPATEELTGEEPVEITAPVTGEVAHTDHAACACAISGANCADHSTAAAAVTWTAWESTTSLPTAAGNYYLTGNVVLSAQQVFNNTTVICMNGFSITRSSAASDFKAMLRIYRGALTLVNCKAEISGGRLVSNANTSKISGGNTADTQAGAIYVDPSRSLAVYGVEFSGNTCTSSNVNGWSAGAILAVANENDTQTVDIGYCRFDGNKSPNATGGAIIIRGGTTDIYNTVFSKNETKLKGGAIYVMNKPSNVTVTNCDFTGNKVTDGSSEGGAAMYINLGNVTLTNVTMTGNENKGNHGTAITYGGNSVVTLDDCTITGNNNTSTSNAKKAGIALVNSNAQMTVKGKTVIDNNMNGLNNANPVECNLYLRTDGSKLTVGALEEGASIRITTGDHVVENDPDVFMNYGDKTPAISAKNNDWLIYENREAAGEKACIIGYNETDRFYFGTLSIHKHAACACAISGATCADHTTAAADVKWTEWTSTTTLPTDAGYYYLAGNVVLTKQQVFSNKTYICLNGFSITQGTRTEATGSVGSMIRVWKGDLVLMNCCAEISDGKLVSNDKTSKISGGTADNTQGGAIYVDPARSLAVYGVEICDNTCTNTNVNGWTAGAILAVANENDTQKITIDYCRFANNKAPNSSGGAIILRGGTTNIRNTVFTGNEAKTKGGAIWMINKAPVLNLVDCTFTGNKTTATDASGGAGLYADYGTATLTRVTMTGNENKGNHGTAITYGGTSQLVLDNCTITGNNNTSTSNAKKGGIGLVNSNASLTLKGKTVIDNNMNGKGGSNPVECNLYLRTDGSKVTIDALEEGASIRITTGDHTVGDDPDVFMAYTDKTPVMNASSQPWLIYENREKAGASSYFIGYSNDAERFYFDTDTTHRHTACACAITGAQCDVTGEEVRWNEWTSTTSLPTTAGYYYLADNVVLSSQQLINEDVKICLNGFSITEGTRTEAAGARNGIIRVGDKGTLTMINCKAVITDGRLAENSAGIKGFTADNTSGAAFHVNSGRTLNLYGIQVSDNACTNGNVNGWTAGGILAVAGDNDALKLNINYCRFEGNKAPNATGGAIILRGGAADIRNTVFSGNEAKIKGGAIFVVNKASTLNLTNCDFTGNKVTDSSSEGGAALYTSLGKATLTNVTMTGNENAGNHGTAITYGGNSELILEDCSITGNNNTSTSNAKKAGIALVNSNAKMTVKGATVITGNMNGLNNKTPVECNLYLRTDGSKLIVDALENGAMIRVSTGDHTVGDDPDVFLTYTANTPEMLPKKQAWIIYENREKAGNANNIVGYSDDDQRFYFGALSNHNHAACACGIEDIYCDNHENGTGAVTYGWTEWESTNSLPTEAGNYFLTGNVVLTKQQYINAKVYICLNGFSITEGERSEAAGSRNAIIRVGDRGDVLLTNCKATIKNGRLAENSAGIKGFTADGTSGGAVHINSGSSFTAVGVVFANNANTNTNVNGWTAGAILAVGNADDNLKLNIDYCRFDGNKATNASGGAIIFRGGSAVITHTAFVGNEANGVKSTGGAVWLTNINPKLTMTDCDFIDNKLTDADSQGGAALYITKGSAVLTDVTMTGNTNTGHHGTAITVGGEAAVTLDNCTITNNTNTNAYSAKKGGVATVSDKAKLTIRGATVVDNNMNGTSGTSVLECNVYLRTAKSKVTVEQLEQGANVNITTGDHNVDSFNIVQPVEDPDSFLTKGVAGNWDPAWDSSWITYENNGRNVGFSLDEEILFYFDMPKDHYHCLCSDGSGRGCEHDKIGWVAWERTDSLPTSSGSYYLTADVTVIKSQNYAGVSEVNICLNGHTITPAKDMKNVILNVYDDAHLSVSDCTATGSGTSYKSGKITKALDGAVRIGKTEKGNDAVLNWYDGTITKNEREYYGGGIRMVGKCTFNMYGGLISNNKCYKAHGGGIGADGGGGVINIYAGTFSGNTAKQSGGAIMGKKAAINIYGGLFTKNSATDNGGAIYNEVGNVTIAGGTFSYNKAPHEKNAKGNYVGQGGAVFVRGDAKNKYGIRLRISGGNFYGNEAWKGGAVLTLTYVQVNITGGKFYQNTAGNNGGGVFIANDCRGSVSGCSIYENKAVSGGGALTYRAKVDFSNCTIRDNVVKEHGAGMLLQRESQVTMKNVTISGNEATKYGGALRADGMCKIEMTECKVIENTSGECGNLFVSAEGTELILNDCSVLKNTAKLSGGGMSAMSYARIIVNGGEISGNSAKEVGGGAWIRKGYMELHGGEISGNTAGISGGGLQVEGIDIIFQRDVLIMTDGDITGNSAPKGGGVLFASGKMTVTGGTIEDNSAEYGGGVFQGSTALTSIENVEVKNNSASVNGGGMYLDRGSRTTMANVKIEGNFSKEDGAGLWVNDDVTMRDITVTGNESDKGVGGIYLEKADYDGHSYVSSVIKIGGKMLVKDNKGTAPGMYIAEGTYVNVAGAGLTSGTYMNVDLASGLLTDTVIGSYDYEGSDLKYVITDGDRSVTEPEKAPVEEQTQTEDEPQQKPAEQEKEFPWLILVIAGGALIVLLILILLLRRKKNGGEKNS